MMLQENRSSHYPHESRFGFGSERLEEIEDHGAETRPNTVADRGVCHSHTHQVSSWLALDMGLFPGKCDSRRFPGCCGALPLQVTRQRLRRRQGKEIVRYLSSQIQYSNYCRSICKINITLRKETFVRLRLLKKWINLVFFRNLQKLCLFFNRMLNLLTRDIF